MKNLFSTLLWSCITVVSMTASAQKNDHPIPINQPNLNKPKLFQAVPDNLPVSISQLSGLLNQPVGTTVDLNFSDRPAFHFSGKVISSVIKFNNTVQSIVINSTNYNGARFTFSKTLNRDGSVSYSGRIVSFLHGDLLELKNQEGSFLFVKRNYYDLVNE